MAEEIKEITDMDEFCRLVNEHPDWCARRIESRELTAEEEAVLLDWAAKHPLQCQSGRVIGIAKFGY